MGRTDFTDYDMLDAMIVFALKRLLDKHVHFRKRASVEEQRAQKYDRFLRGRPIAYMIYEHFRATGDYETVQGLSDLFHIRLQNGLIPGGKEHKGGRQTIFFTRSTLLVDSDEEEPRDDSTVPQKVHCHSHWKRNQDAVCWVKLS